MTSLEASGPPAAAGAESPVSSGWSLVGIFAAATVGAHSKTAWNMIGSWFDQNGDMGHGILVPFAVGYMIWNERDRLRAIPARPALGGIALILLAATLMLIAGVAQWTWVSRMSFVVSLMAVVLAIRGWETVRAMAYPLGTMLLMVAPPTFVYERITLPLQLFASRLGEISLEAFGYSVLREGNILEMAGQQLSVEEACSGIRALVALLFMIVLYNYFLVPKRWMRAVLMLATVPIAIAGNAFRIFATGVVSVYDRQLAHGAIHDAFGYISIVSAALLCLLLHWILNRIERLPVRSAA